MNINSLRKIAERQSSEYETTESGLNLIKADLDRVDDSLKRTRVSIKLPRITIIVAIFAFVIYSFVFGLGVALLMVIAIGVAFVIIEPEVDTLAGFSKESIDALKKYRINQVTSVFDGIEKKKKSL
jgi:ABC-type transport system involved in cytochrome bd biosynthesis fused ATPase/permease subunit